MIDGVVVIDAAICALLDAVPVAVKYVDAVVDSSKMSLLTPSSLMLSFLMLCFLMLYFFILSISMLSFLKLSFWMLYLTPCLIVVFELCC